jgi:copper homeostasis protein
LRKQLAGLPGLDTYLTAGSADGVAAGLPVLVAEAARAAAGQPGYEPRIMAGGGLTTAHVPRLRAAGLDAFHVGGAVRPEGWSGPVSAQSVAEWRTLLDG